MPWAKKIKLKFPLPKTFIGFVNIRYSILFPTLANLSILFFFNTFLFSAVHCYTLVVKGDKKIF